MKNKKGFTLVELLAVIVVLAIVMLVVSDRVGDAMLKSRGNSLVLQIKSIGREIEKIGAMENIISTIQIDKIVKKSDLTYIGYIKAGTGNFDNDAIVVQAKKGSKFANIAFTNDLEELSNFVYEVNDDKVILGNEMVKNSKKWLREPLFYLKVTVPIEPIKQTELPNKPYENKYIKPLIKIYSPDNLPIDGNFKKYDIGQMISIGSENFYVIEDKNDELVLLSKYNLSTSLNMQSTNYDSVKFSNNNYWISNGKLKPKYGDGKTFNNGHRLYTYEKPPYIYYENEYLVPILDNYKNYIEKNFHKNISIIRLISYEELINLGCRGYSSYSCSGTKYSWVIGNYWAGSAYADSNVWNVSSSGFGFSSEYYYNHGIRPVIEISKYEL